MKHFSLAKSILLRVLLIVGIGVSGTASVLAQNLSGTITDERARPVAGAEVRLDELPRTTRTDRDGKYTFQEIPDGTYTMYVFAEGFATDVYELKHRTTTERDLVLLPLSENLTAVEIEVERRRDFEMEFMRNVEDFAIYAAKKSEVIRLDHLTANLATNNPRQVYRSIPGLNIWESDGAGLQLSIGARGLDPNRTSNFNVRQNGYDISADALGYPESYYTPPVLALERIEIVRGAASLQYGPQFGGLLNFEMRRGAVGKPFEFTTENTVGSFGLFSSFNSIGGTHNKLRYYGFFQRKQGNGWRENAEFFQNTGYGSLEWQVNERLSASFQLTLMNYLAQQPGGLQDFEFEQNARQSKRERNWFDVNWRLAALLLDYRFTERTKLNSRFFLLDARRQALGELGPINRPDPGRERDLIRGQYDNIGNETRFIHRYGNQDRPFTFLTGVRVYRGYSTGEQGLASADSDPDFRFLNPAELEGASYTFPSFNTSFFAENLFLLSEKWSVTPGFRLEHIRTAAEGFFRERITSGGMVIFEQTFPVDRSNRRTIGLFGLGVGYKPSETVEVYANLSQNYRSINFTDLSVINPNLIVDSLLRDERGYNADLGARGQLGSALRFDASLFYLRYDDRIGVDQLVVPDPIVIERAVSYRTNIGDARIIGLEAFLQLDLLELLKKQTDKFAWSVYLNGSAIHGRYLSGGPAIVGNEVELIPPWSLKSGTNLRLQQFRLSYQFSHVDRHFSDATNATGGIPDATRGIIPSYSVHDLSASYDYRRFRFSAGVNNLLDARYFTRRAVAYPGPGIISAEGRNLYFGVRATF